MATPSPRTSLEDQLRSAIEDWGKSLRALALLADVGYGELRRFCRRRAFVSIAAAEKLFASLGREVIDGGIEAAIRAAIKADPRGRRRLARDAGVHPQTIWRFGEGKGVRLDTADKILAALPNPPELVGKPKPRGLAAMANKGLEVGPLGGAIRPVLASAAGLPDDELRRRGIDPCHLRQVLARELDPMLATVGRILEVLGFVLKIGEPAEGWTPDLSQAELRRAVKSSPLPTSRISRRSGVGLQTVRAFARGTVDVRLSTADRIASALGVVVSVLAADAADPSGQTGSLATAVRERFRASGESLNAVARKSGLAGPTVGRFMAGGNVQPATLARIAGAMGVHPDAGPAPLTSSRRGDDECPFVLDGPSKPPAVGGQRASKPLSAAAYDIIAAMIALHWAGKHRNPESVIAKKSGRSNPIRTLNRLRKNLLYDAHLFFPGENVHGGYGFKWPSQGDKGSVDNIA